MKPIKDPTGPLQGDAAKDAYKEAYARGHLVGMKAERDRICGILSCGEAKGREDAAQKLAADPSFSVELAKKVLAASPRAAGPLHVAMGQIENPRVSVHDPLYDGVGPGNVPRTYTDAVYAQRRADVESHRRHEADGGAHG